MSERVLQPSNDNNTMSEEDHGGTQEVDGTIQSESYERGQKRRIRKEYRKLINETEENTATYIQANSTSLFRNIEKANELYAQVKSTQEATLDSRLLVLSADLGRHRARKMRFDHSAFDVDEYLLKLGKYLQVNRVSTEEEESMDATVQDWARIGRLAAASSARIPTVDFMLGPLSIEKKERRIERRAPLNKNAASLKRPTELAEGDIQQQENETTKNVLQISQILYEVTEARNAPVSFFEFIVNPESFSQTVENLFYLSFLIRDGKASITDDEETGQPMLDRSCVPTEQDRRNNLVKKQLIMDMDIATYKLIIETYGIRKTMIPTRVARAVNVTGKWYG